MAIRGRKPVPTHLKLVRGNPGRRPLPRSEPMPGGVPVRPAWLSGRGAELWAEVLRFGFWLTRADGYKLAAWCERQADFEDPEERRKWRAADRREHRAAGSELGFDPTARARIGAPPPAAKDESARFFT